MIFSNREFAAVTQVAMLMIAADRKITLDEMKALAVIYSKCFDVSSDQFDSLVDDAVKLEYFQALALVGGMDVERKYFVASLLAVIMTADRDIDDAEHAMWVSISKICDLPKMTLKEAVDYMMKRLHLKPSDFE